MARAAARQEAQDQEDYGSVWLRERLDAEESRASSSSTCAMNPHSLSIFSWNAGNLQRQGQTPHSAIRTN